MPRNLPPLRFYLIQATEASLLYVITCSAHSALPESWGQSHTLGSETGRARCEEVQSQPHEHVGILLLRAPGVGTEQELISQEAREDPQSRTNGQDLSCLLPRVRGHRAFPRI